MRDWVKSLPDNIWNWYLTVKTEEAGRIRYCAAGDLFIPSAAAGLGMSCLMLKSLHMMGLVPRVADLQEWIAHICSFQTNTGYFADTLTCKNNDVRTLRAETRQAIATLMCLDVPPRIPLLFLPKTKDEVLSFIRSFDWQRPWASGSHVGHLMAFVYINHVYFGHSDEFLDVIDEELTKLQNKNDGCWYSSKTSSAEKINGAMKIISGYVFANRPFRQAHELTDFALQHLNAQDACHNVDILYVLYHCSLTDGYRLDEIRSFAEKRLDIIEKFRNPDGAFSFHEKMSGREYYGCPTSKGRAVSDVHGTTLFAWAVTMISILTESDSRFQMPVT